MEAENHAVVGPRGLSAWAAVWLSILVATLLAVVVLARLSAEGARTAVESALTDHLAAQAGEADGALHELPIEILLAMGGERSAAELRAQVDNLAEHGGLRGLALMGPDGQVVGHGGRWVPSAAEKDLIARAAAGSVMPGPLYHDREGELYQTAYRPLTGHPGWVVAVEGSAATLGAVDDLERTQWAAGAVVVVLAGVIGAVLATLVSRPLQRLSTELSAARPGSPPSTVGDYGFREVRRVSNAARGLLGAIRTRDTALQAAHRREIDQLTRMAAEIAHEVGNPLNAIGLSVERLGVLEDPARRLTALERVRGQLAELEAIVERLRDVTRPLIPHLGVVDLGAAIDTLAAEMDPLVVAREGGATVESDRGMVLQILRNLLLNAHQCGARHAAVTLTNVGDTTEIRVTDDGPGVPESEVADMFGWFHTTRATGSGLGLPVSRRTAEALGGTLVLERPSPATFRLTLPRRAGAVPAPGSP